MVLVRIGPVLGLLDTVMRMASRQQCEACKEPHAAAASIRMPRGAQRGSIPASYISGQIRVDVAGYTITMKRLSPFLLRAWGYSCYNICGDPVYYVSARKSTKAPRPEKDIPPSKMIEVISTPIFHILALPASNFSYMAFSNSVIIFPVATSPGGFT